MLESASSPRQAAEPRVVVTYPRAAVTEIRAATTEKCYGGNPKTPWGMPHAKREPKQRAKPGSKRDSSKSRDNIGHAYAVCVSACGHVCLLVMCKVHVLRYGWSCLLSHVHDFCFRQIYLYQHLLLNDPLFKFDYLCCLIIFLKQT